MLKNSYIFYLILIAHKHELRNYKYKKITNTEELYNSFIDFKGRICKKIQV